MKLTQKLIFLLTVFITFPNLVFADSFYAGIDLGKSKTKTTESTPDNAVTHYYLTNASQFNINGRDYLTGLHLGYNHFINNFFIGPEFRFVKNNQDIGITTGRFAATNDYTVKYDDTKTLAMRFGIVENKISYYLLGGFAQSNIYIKADEGGAGSHVGQSKQNHNGTILGIGAETTVLENVSIGLQYNEINLKNKNHTINDCCADSGYQGPDVVSVNPNIKTLSIRASYLF
jgi:opacity protein-like surface antigen